MSLSLAQRAHFDQQGFVVIDPIFSEVEIDHLSECYMATVERLRGEQSLVNVQSGKDDDADFHVYQIRTAHMQHAAFNMLIHDSRLLDVVESLLGPDLRLVHYQGLYKPARTGGEVDWHQDNYYFEVAGDRTISVWLALDEATAENGCMWYLPGVHHELMEHQQLWNIEQKKGFYFSIPDMRADGAVAAPVPKGGLSIHHSLIPHRSLKNATDGPRRGLAMHFMDAKAGMPGFLKRGLTPDAMPLLRGVAA